MFVLVGLLAIGCYWVAVTASKEEAIRATPSPTPTPDAAAQLVQHCGSPDGQAFLSAKPQTKQLERQSLLYRAARVKAVLREIRRRVWTGGRA